MLLVHLRGLTAAFEKQDAKYKSTVSFVLFDRPPDAVTSDVMQSDS